MPVEWDSRKAAANLQKHGVDFADAATALEDDRAVTVRDVLSGNDVRLISARPATLRERRQYESRP